MPQVFALRNPHQGGIRQVHWLVRVFVHEFANPGDVTETQREKLNSVLNQHLPDRILSFRYSAQQVYRLRKDRPHGPHRPVDPLERGRASNMMLVVRTHDGDQRAGIDEDHNRPRRALSSSVSRRPVFVESVGSPPWTIPTNCFMDSYADPDFSSRSTQLVIASRSTWDVEVPRWRAMRDTRRRISWSRRNVIGAATLQI